MSPRYAGWPPALKLALELTRRRGTPTMRTPYWAATAIAWNAEARLAGRAQLC